MASYLRKLPETVTLTCSKYALELDSTDREQFATDAENVVRRLISEAGAPAPNAILMDEAARDAVVAGDGGAPHPPVTVHVDSPPAYSSRYIIFVMPQ
jgi:hypothetical protein